ncbi:MAG: hypothetical protein ACK5YR_12245 [Pirellula sp.]
MSTNELQGSEDAVAPYWHTDPRFVALAKAWPGLDEAAKSLLAQVANKLLVADLTQ